MLAHLGEELVRVVGLTDHGEAVGLEHAHDTGVSEVDLRAGDFPYKYKWANATHRTRSLALTTPGRGHDAMMAARRLTMSLRARRLARVRDRHT